MKHKPIVVLLALLVIGQLFIPAASGAGGEARKARIAVRSLNLRGGPSTEQTVIRSLSQGTEVDVVESSGDWSRVILDDGAEGWVASRFLEFLPDRAGEETPAGAGETEKTLPVPPPPILPERGEKGGSILRSALKWGSLAGAAALGGLAYMERGEGDDAYDEYKTLHGEGKYNEADDKYDETVDHDDKAKVFAIAAGGFAGLFLVQQFLLGGGDDNGAAPVAFVPSPDGGRVVLRASF